MPKHKTCDTNSPPNDSSSEDSDDERLKALVSEAVDPVLHKTLYEKTIPPETTSIKQGRF